METKKIRTIDTIQKYIFGLPILNYKEVEKQILYNYSTIIERIEKMANQNYETKSELYGDYALSPETTPSVVVSGPKIYHK